MVIGHDVFVGVGGICLGFVTQGAAAAQNGPNIRLTIVEDLLNITQRVSISRGFISLKICFSCGDRY